MTHHFTVIDTAVVVVYLVATTMLGAVLAGKQSTIRDFFLAGRKIPWLAVAGSNIATEISAVTLVSVPAVVFAPGGNLTYLQLALGALLARVIVAVWFVPAFYEREIYSPYDYMGRWLGPHVRIVTSGLFVLGAVLGQSVRVLLTAIVLEVISGIPLWLSIWLTGAAAVVWSWLGGITTVIWTDVIQFLVFVLNMLAALVYTFAVVPGGAGEVWRLADAAPGGSKLMMWDFTLDPRVTFTLWTALIANTIMCIGVYATDQLMAQRMFCCRGPREARWAVLASSAGLLVTVLAAFVGLALYAYYQHFPLSPEDAAAVREKSDRIFPIFVLKQMPAGLVGLVIAGILAAAISTLDGVLIALSQVVITTVYRPWREALRNPPAQRPAGTCFPAPGPPGSDFPPRESSASARGAESRAESVDTGETHYVRVSRVLVVLWATLLCGMAQVSVLALERYQDILDLALAMATYTAGPLLAAFLLAFLRLNVDARGILWGAPLAVLAVFAVVWHAPWAQWTAIIGVALVTAGWIIQLRRGRGATISCRSASPLRRLRADVTATVLIFAVGAAIVLVSLYRHPQTGVPLSVAWPWNAPIGLAVAMLVGYVAARPREIAESSLKSAE